jgi:translation elongation factor EF-G
MAESPGADLIGRLAGCGAKSRLREAFTSTRKGTVDRSKGMKLGEHLELGIFAHVDAGRTSLTERPLHAAGAIDEIGSVDDGSTQTDSLTLERARGITIKSAVVSFAIDDVTVNLIDTPGHPDFIAEGKKAIPRTATVRGSSCLLEGETPAAKVYDLQQQLPALTRGEGVLESAFDRYRPVSGVIPARPRSDQTLWTATNTCCTSSDGPPSEGRVSRIV